MYPAWFIETRIFLYAALDTTACAAFIKESRMNLANANKFHRKSRGSRLVHV
jgi:hypothetical protein